MDLDNDELRRWEHSADGKDLAVYSFDADPGAAHVVLLHELPGLSTHCIGFGRRLRSAGFNVAMPLLFGELGQSAPLRGVYQMWCLRREFELFRNGRSSPIAGWIRSLCRELGGRSGARVGVVGMCATGGLVLSVMYEPVVGAAVAAQPSLPFRLFYTGRRPGNLGASAEDVARSVAAATPLMTTRFARDPICPANRGRGLEAEFGDGQFVRREAAGWRHATLTVDAERSQLVPAVVAFLEEHLRAGGDDAGRNTESGGG